MQNRISFSLFVKKKHTHICKGSFKLPHDNIPSLSDGIREVFFCFVMNHEQTQLKKNKSNFHWMRCHTPVIPALRTQSQEDYELKASLGNKMRPCLKKTKQKQSSLGPWLGL
jgi:hypothetical protein